MLTIEVLANPDCAHCRHAVDEVTDAAARQGIPVAGVDLRKYPQAAGGFERSPLVRVGRRLFAGHVDAALLREALAAARDRNV